MSLSTWPVSTGSKDITLFNSLGEASVLLHTSKTLPTVVESEGIFFIDLRILACCFSCSVINTYLENNLLHHHNSQLYCIVRLRSSCCFIIGNSILVTNQLSSKNIKSTTYCCINSSLTNITYDIKILHTTNSASIGCGDRA